MRKLAYFLLGIAGGILVALLAFDQAFPSVDPSIWRVYAEATGVWPSDGMTPVLWRRLMSLGCTPVAVSAFSAGLLAFGVFDIFWRVTLFFVSPQEERRNWHRLTVPTLSLLGAALAVFSEPVWRQALSGSPALLTLSLLLLSLDLFLASFYSKVTVDAEGNLVGSAWADLNVALAYLLAGALTVETPAAVALPPVFSLVGSLVLRLDMEDRCQAAEGERQVFAPVRLPNWIALFLWAVGLSLVCVLADVSMDSEGFRRYLLELVRDVREAATPLGWTLWAGCRLVPLVMIGGLLPALTARDSQKSFVFGVVSLLIGSVSLAFVSSAVRGDWMLVPAAAVQSALMQSLGAVLSAQTAVLALALFAWLAFHEMPRDAAFRGLAVWCVSIALIVSAAVAAAGIGRGQARQVRQVVAEAVEETVREAKGLSRIFTDGSSDVGIELVARRSGNGLRALPLIKGGPLASTNDASSLLREWVGGNSSNLQTSAVQLGLDLWRRERKAVPSASGLLARFDWPAGERERGVSFAEQLGERMLELVRTGAPAHDSEPNVRALFSSILWRLSRLARQRGDMDLADRLDEANVTRHQTMELIHRERTAAFRQLTDTEGLQLALNRADFVGARHFARRILERAPDDASANFATGMCYLLEKNTKEAIFYLEKAHRAKPGEPAILNNLAIAYLRMNDLAQAEIWAKKALERAPDIPEIRETVRRIEARLSSPKKTTKLR